MPRRRTARSIGRWASRALARHRQRHGADPSGVAHRPHRARRHGAESAARAEQRAGRVRHGRDAIALSRLQRVDDEAAASKWEQRNIEPGGSTATWADHHRNPERGGPGGVRALYIMGENPMMSEPNLNHTRHMTTVGIPRRAGPVHQRVRRLCRCLSARSFLGGERKARSPIPTAASSACARRWSRAASPEPDWQILCDLAARIEKKLGRAQTAFWAYETSRRSAREMGRRGP